MIIIVIIIDVFGEYYAIRIFIQIIIIIIIMIMSFFLLELELLPFGYINSIWCSLLWILDLCCWHTDVSNAATIKFSCMFVKWVNILSAFLSLVHFLSSLFLSLAFYLAPSLSPFCPQTPPISLAPVYSFSLVLDGSRLLASVCRLMFSFFMSVPPLYLSLQLVFIVFH